MGAIRRGIKNAFRNTIRTLSITLILALSIAMSLIMLLALKTVQAKIDSVKSSVGNTLTVSPAGVRGFEGGGTLLTSQNVTDVASISHVSGAVSILSDRLENPSSGASNPNRPTNSTQSTNNTTNLTSPITPGSFGNRQQQNSTGTAPATNFTLPVQIFGINKLDSSQSLTALGVSQFDITAGDKIDATSSENIVMIGKDLATKNNLAVGSTFEAYGQTLTVGAIFDTGSTFTNAVIVAPIKTVQTLSSQANQVNSIIVQADSIDNISSVQSAITAKLGSDKVDVTSQVDQANNAVKPLENIKTISTYSLIGSLVAGAIIIFLTMIMIVRERRREIGVLKAIGSSNLLIVKQFVAESLVLTLLGSLVGMILGFIFSNPVLNILVTNSESTTSTAARQAGGGGQFAIRLGGGLSGARDALSNIHTVVGWNIIGYGLLAAILIAILGSAIPAFFISKVRPAEAMRVE